jgi:hypothetical protein
MAEALACILVLKLQTNLAMRTVRSNASSSMGALIRQKESTAGKQRTAMFLLRSPNPVWSCLPLESAQQLLGRQPENIDGMSFSSHSYHR